MSANLLFQIPQRYRFSSKSQPIQCSVNVTLVVLDTTKVQIFKQITTLLKVFLMQILLFQIPQRYRFSSKSQQIPNAEFDALGLFQIPQRYRFSSKSQLYRGYRGLKARCFRYHKGTDFQANHNTNAGVASTPEVVLDTTKVQIFKQITTNMLASGVPLELFQIPQRYRFSSKSQHVLKVLTTCACCFRYHKGTDFQANHNYKA